MVRTREPLHHFDGMIMAQTRQLTASRPVIAMTLRRSKFLYCSLVLFLDGVCVYIYGPCPDKTIQLVSTKEKSISSVLPPFTSSITVKIAGYPSSPYASYNFEDAHATNAEKQVLM